MSEFNITEARLQQQAFTWFNNTYPAERGRLFLIHNNPRNVVDGAKLIGMGLLPGVADMGYLDGNGVIVFLETKLPNKKQSEYQVWFEEVAIRLKCEYKVWETLDEFKKIIDSYGRLHTPLPTMPMRRSAKMALRQM